MALVQSCQFGLVEALNDCENRRIDETYVGVCVPAAQLADTSKVRGDKWFNLIVTRVDIIEKCQPNLRIESSFNEVIQF